MAPRSGRAVALLCASAFLLIAVLPHAYADHAYSHRYIVIGRVIDDAGNPIVGEQVEVGLDASMRGKVESLCARQPNTETDAWGETTTRTETNEYGEFIYCFHMHALPSKTDAQVTAKVLGAEESITMTTNLRRDFMTMTVPGNNGTASDAYSESYLVTGRVFFKESSKNVEGVSVYGDTLKQEDVKVTFTPASGAPVTLETKTNGYGDYAVRLNVSAAATGGQVTVEAAGRTETQDADMQTRASDVVVLTRSPTAVKDTITKVGPLVVLLGLVGAGAYFIFGTKSAPTGKKAKR